jgi:hypothetical protein
VLCIRTHHQPPLLNDAAPLFDARLFVGARRLLVVAHWVRRHRLRPHGVGPAHAPAEHASRVTDVGAVQPLADFEDGGGGAARVFFDPEKRRVGGEEGRFEARTDGGVVKTRRRKRRGHALVELNVQNR